MGSFYDCFHNEYKKFAHSCNMTTPSCRIFSIMGSIYGSVNYASNKCNRVANQLAGWAGWVDEIQVWKEVPDFLDVHQELVNTTTAIS